MQTDSTTIQNPPPDLSTFDPSSQSNKNDCEKNESEQKIENEGEKENEKDDGRPPENNANSNSKSKDKSNSKQKVSLEDFEAVGSLGNGSFGEVSLVKRKGSEQYFAMKSINKNFLFKEKKQYQVYIEREVLMKMSHPNLIKLFFSFQDKYKLYFVLEYCEGGEFSDFLKINKKLDKKIIQFYAAEIVNILEFLHINGIAHRDMKPENLMLNASNHLKVIDFGTAYFFKTEFMDSDLLEKINKIRQHEKEEDIIDEYQSKHKATFEIPDDAKDLINKLLVRTPSKRLGAGPKGSENDFAALKAHKFFEGIVFETLHAQEAPKLATSDSLKKVLPPSNSPQNSIKQAKTFYDDGGLDLIKNISNIKTDPEQMVNETMGVSASLSEGKILLTGLVMKKCGWIFYKPRQLILKDNHRLLYYDPQTNKLKGEIKLNSDVKIEIQEKKKFIITIPTRKYFFKEMEHPATMWVDMIFTVINSNT